MGGSRLPPLLLILHPQLTSVGAQLVAVGNGSLHFAQKFVEDLKFSGAVFRDPESHMFKAANLTRLDKWEATKRFFGPSSIMWFKNNVSGKGYNEDSKGDGLQLGGVFVLIPAEAGGMEVAYSFLEQENKVSKFADNEAILAAVGLKKGAGQEIGSEVNVEIGSAEEKEEMSKL